MRLILNWILSALAILLVAYLLPGARVTGFLAALVVALVLGLINALIRPLLMLLTLPVTVMTLGLFSLVVNALMVMLADRLVDGFSVDGFWWALAFSLLLGAVNAIFRDAASGEPAAAA